MAFIPFGSSFYSTRELWPLGIRGSLFTTFLEVAPPSDPLLYCDIGSLFGHCISYIGPHVTCVQNFSLMWEAHHCQVIMYSLSGVAFLLYVGYLGCPSFWVAPSIDGPHNFWFCLCFAFVSFTWFPGSDLRAEKATPYPLGWLNNKSVGWARLVPAGKVPPFESRRRPLNLGLSMFL